jgi:hypothetical protein
MTITLNSPIVGRSAATVDDVIRGAYGHEDAYVPNPVREYLAELHRLCELVGFDFRILAAQSYHECFNPTTKQPWDSFWFTQRLNPAGIGITGDPAQNAASHTWENGAASARAHVAHMIAYTSHAGAWPSHEIDVPSDHDPRWDAVQDAGFFGSVGKLGDLGNGKWATDKRYAEKIAAKANQIFKGEQPMADIVFGTVPYPDVIPSHLPASNSYVQEGGAPKDEHVEAVFWHIMVGTWSGTNSWFHAGKAATAYGVSVQSVDGHGGRIYEWIPRNTGWYGESSGPAIAPYGDGAKLIARVGVNSVNRTTKAIEISGNPSTPLDPASRLAIVKLTAFFADKHRIPWNEFPNVPGEDRSYVIWHNEVTGLAFKSCPGAVVMNETPALIVQVANYLKQFQQPGSVIVTPPQYAKSELPDWWGDALEQSYPTDQSENGVRYYVCRRNFVAKTGTRRLNKSGDNPERSGPNLKLAEKVHGERYVIDGRERRILTNDGHFIAANKLSPPVKIG